MLTLSRTIGMFHGTLALTLLATTILYSWKMWKKKQALKYVLPMISENSRNTRSNPNIGNDGRNVNIVGTAGTILVVSLMIVFILTNIMYVNGWKIGKMEKMNAFMKPLLTSFLLPGLFYLHKPGCIDIIKDALI